MQVGETIGDFLILDELGAGGMGAVYIGYREGSRNLVVIKTLFEQWAKEEQMVKRFMREADVYQKLDHPNIVHYVASGENDGTHYIAMEYVGSKPLDAILKKKGRLQVEMAVKCLGHLADAVAHAHERGIIHRDLKPQNIMLSEDGVLKLLDFGIAKADDDFVKTTEGSVLGTFQYASPEQNQGKEIDQRSDLYALGAILYELLTGERPFKGTSLLEVIQQQIRGEITTPSVVNTAIPKGLERIIMKLMSKDPRGRYDTAKDLIFDIEKYKEDPVGHDPDKLFDDDELVEVWEQAQQEFAADNIDAALDLAKQVEAQRKDSADVYVLLAKIQAKKKWKPPAKKSFQRALELDPDNADYMLQYGIMLASLKDYDEAEKQFDAVLDREPENMYANSHKRRLEEQRRRDEADKAKMAEAVARAQEREGFTEDSSAESAGPAKSAEASPTTSSAVPVSPDALARAKKLSRIWWGAGYLVRGKPIRFVILTLSELLVIASIAMALMGWFGTDPLDLVAVAKKTGVSGLVGLADTIQKKPGMHGVMTLLGRQMKWIVAGLSGIVFLLMEIRVPARIGHDAGGAG